MKIRAFAIVGLLAAVAAGCGSSPTAPSATPDGFLSGQWTGTMTVTSYGGPSVSGSTTWTLTTIPDSGGFSYRASIQSQNPWLPITTTATATLVPPGTPPSQVSTQGDYPSPRGCRGQFGSFGVADTGHLSADFHGVDCDNQTFSGTVELSR